MSNLYIKIDEKNKPLKAIYVGKDGVPVKVWDKDFGLLDKKLYDTFVKEVVKNG